MAVLKGAGIGFSLARTWPGTRTHERAKKNRGKTRICPLCPAQLALDLAGGAQ